MCHANYAIQSWPTTGNEGGRSPNEAWDTHMSGKEGPHRVRGGWGVGDRVESRAMSDANIQQPATAGTARTARAFAVGCWMLDVGRWPRGRPAASS
jgi:hypothetical protein